MLKRCMEDIAQSDLFVLVIGYRYGWIPTTADGGDGEKSITIREYEFWKLLERLCGQWPAIVFMASNNDCFLDDNGDQELAARQLLFRARLQRETTIHRFHYLPDSDSGQNPGARPIQGGSPTSASSSQRPHGGANKTGIAPLQSGSPASHPRDADSGAGPEGCT